ncbi:DUF6357 family protein [Glycomyces paridis]|uniref:DUF6357 family protein n=1 Tax=Glycomyces paridis TaxID=2126555 RepID=UPI00195EEA62|nr:DUF6357 family protein [Glycomyces paridis]
MSRIEFARENRWLPRVLRQDRDLALEVVGGADANHDPRIFVVPVGEAHLAVLRDDLSRHLILWSALLPLCHDAGVSGPLDQDAAAALLDPILLAAPEDVDAFLGRAEWDRVRLVAHGADVGLLEGGRVLAAMGAARETADWSRAQEYEADRDRARRGVALSPLDAAILKYTGQYLHRSTIPRRDPGAVDPGLLPEVLEVIGAAERACAGMRIARDPRRGKTGTDKQDWRRMEEAARAAVRGARPDSADDAVNTVGFLICAEAAADARKRPFDADADRSAGARALEFSDDKDAEQTWTPGAPRAAAEAFWEFVAERHGSGNQVFTIEDEALGEGLQLYFYADAVTRITTATPADGEEKAVYRVEYSLVDGLARYLAVVRAFVDGGCAALDGLGSWTTDVDEFEQARRHRDEANRQGTDGGEAGPDAAAPRRYVFRDDTGTEEQASVRRPQEGYVAFSAFFKGRDGGVVTIEDQASGERLVLMPGRKVIARAEGGEGSRTEYLKVDRANAYMPAAMLFFENGFSGLRHFGQWMPRLDDLEASPEARGRARAEAVTTASDAIVEVARIWAASGIVDTSDRFYVFFESDRLEDRRAERAELIELVGFLGLDRVDPPAGAADGEVWVRTDPRLDAEFERWS